MRVKLMLCLIGLAGISCTEDGEMARSPGEGEAQAVVFEAGPHVGQCEGPVVTPAQSAAKLTAAGIEVERSSCGHRVGVMYPALCGAQTGELILHDIPESQLEAARGAGFGSAADLAEWKRSSCTDYIHAIEVAQGTTSCADIRNRVLLILEPGNSYRRTVLLDQAGNCSDASYRQVLYGDEDGRKTLCSNMESIAGPQKGCPAGSYLAMFETILANLDAPDLGLGSGFDVRQIHPAK